MRTALAMAAALLLAACGSTPKENYYTLSAETGGPPAAGAGSVSVHVAAPVAVPEAVDRSPMVIRTGASQVDIDDLHRWVEPLKHAIPRALAELLMRELGTPHVVAGRLTSATSADYRVVLDVQRFDSSFAEGATLDAAWTVTPTPNVAARTSLFGVDCSSANSCIAVGEAAFGHLSPFDAAPVVERWDGTSWQIMPTPTTSGSLLMVAIILPLRRSMSMACI